MVLAASHAGEAVAEPARDALFVIHEEPYAEVIVNAWTAGARQDLDGERRCVVLFGVNSKGEQTAWPQDCSSDVKADAAAAAQRWRYRVGNVEPGEIFARFHATFVYPETGDPFVLMNNDVVAKPPERYPAGLIVRSRFQVTHRPALKLRGVTLESGERCEVRVRVAANGKPTDVTATACPASMVSAVQTYVRKWRWAPLQENGEGFTGETTVVVRIP